MKRRQHYSFIVSIVVLLGSAAIYIHSVISDYFLNEIVDLMEIFMAAISSICSAIVIYVYWSDNQL